LGVAGRRASKIERASSPAESRPRAKSIAPEGRALDRYADASTAFDAICDDCGGLGGIDAKYADLAAAAAKLIESLLLKPAAPAAGPLKDLLEDYARGTRRVGDLPEDDIRVAELALRAESVRRSVS